MCPSISGNRQSPRRIILSLALCFIVILMLGAMNAQAQSISFVTVPDDPSDGVPFTIMLNGTNGSLATVNVQNASGTILWSETVAMVNGSAEIGPISLGQGNYTLSGVFWQANSTNVLLPTDIDIDFTVGGITETATEKFTAIQVIIAGISIVFLVLGLLSLITFISGKAFPKAAPLAVEAPVDDSERVAAIAMALKHRRG